MFDVQGRPDSETMQGFWEEQPARPVVRRRAVELFKGIIGCIEELDAKIAAASHHWRVERMSKVDRNVLRMATYEMLYDPKVPPRVCIDEAVEIARKYGDSTSPAFVNGILDRIWKEEGPVDS